MPGALVEKVVEAIFKTLRQYKLLVPELASHLRGKEQDPQCRMITTC
jgi:hypothetical protein